MIQVKFYGSLTTVMNMTATELEEVYDTDTVVAKFPSLAAQRYIIAVDRQVITGNVQLNEGQTVAFMPPFSGG